MSSTHIYYFSGTGNSLHIARSIAALCENATVKRIHAHMPAEENQEEVDAMGIVFPVYAWGAPQMVHTFLKNGPFDKAKYRFAVASFGAFGADAFRHVVSAFKKRKLSIDAAAGIRMPSNYVTSGTLPSEDECKKILENSEVSITKIAESIAAKKTVAVPRVGFPISLLSILVHPMFLRFTAKKDDKFNIREGCTSCGVCTQVCPASNIKLDDKGHPKWEGRCESCLACIHACPEKVIEHGTTTVGIKRYRHPSVTREDLILFPKQG